MSLTDLIRHSLTYCHILPNSPVPVTPAAWSRIAIHRLELPPSYRWNEHFAASNLGQHLAIRRSLALFRKRCSIAESLYLLHLPLDESYAHTHICIKNIQARPSWYMGFQNHCSIDCHAYTLS